MSPTVSRAALECWSDRGLVKRVLPGVTGAYEIIRRRYNYGLCRVALRSLKHHPPIESWQLCSAGLLIRKARRSDMHQSSAARE